MKMPAATDTGAPSTIWTVQLRLTSSCCESGAMGFLSADVPAPHHLHPDASPSTGHHYREADAILAYVEHTHGNDMQHPEVIPLLLRAQVHAQLAAVSNIIASESRGALNRIPKGKQPQSVRY